MPEANSKLRVAIDAGRAANMPKVNIERAISKGSRGGEDLEEIVYQGFGPDGIAVMVEVATDNRNRTGQEIKGIFERSGGRLAGPGAVSFNFERKGLILLKKEKDVDNQMLRLIDLGVEDMEETEEDIEVYVGPNQLLAIRKKIEDSGFSVQASEQVEKSKNFIRVTDVKKAKKILSFLNSLNEHEDVQKVFANVDIPNNLG